MADGPSGRDRSTSFHVVRYGFLTVVWLVTVLMGVRMLILGSVMVGLVLVVLGSVTVYLTTRALVRGIRSVDERAPASGDVPKSEFDYLVWVALGFPVIMGILLLVMAAAGSLDR